MNRWGPLMRLAAARFSITPEAFWRLSLVEWRALTGEAAPGALTRAGLEALAERYPDKDL